MVISDEQIKKDLVNQLYWDQMVDVSAINVEVSGGAVKLKGTVPSLGSLRAAYNDTIAIPGVISVVNELEVALPPAIPAATDDEIKTRSEMEFSARIVLISPMHLTSEKSEEYMGLMIL